jgi:hypothetical protein
MRTRGEPGEPEQNTTAIVGAAWLAAHHATAAGAEGDLNAMSGGTTVDGVQMDDDDRSPDADRPDGLAIDARAVSVTGAGPTQVGRATGSFRHG